MPKVLVLFHSRTGNSAHLADAIADGARSVRFTEVDVRRIEELAEELAPEGATAGRPDRQASGDELRQRYRTLEHVEQLADYDALVLGGATEDGVPSAVVARLLDELRPLAARGALLDRVGSAFASLPSGDGDPARALAAMLTAMGSFGMLLVPAGPSDATTAAAGSPLGVTATAGGAPPTDAQLALARHQGRRVAKVAEWVRHAKGHEAGGHHHHH